MRDAAVTGGRRPAGSEPLGERPFRVRTSIVVALSVCGSLAALVGVDAAVGPSLIVATSAVAIIAAFLVVLFKIEPSFFALTFLIVLGQFGALVSGILIESGAYVPEQRLFGFATGSTVRLAFYFALMQSATLVAFRATLPRGRTRPRLSRSRLSPRWRWLLYVLAGTALAFVYLGLAVNGAPILKGTDRFTYWRTNGVPLLQLVHNQLSVVIFLLGLSAATARRRAARWSPLALFALTLLYFILQGEKFTALIIVGYSFFLPAFLHHVWTQRSRPSLARAGLVTTLVAAALTGLILYQYATAFESKTPTQRLQERITLQGHVWWGIDSRYHSESLELEPAKQRELELAALTSLGQPSGAVGMHRLMTLVAPEDLVDRYLDQGIRFTMGYPAIGLVLFGYGGLVALQIAAGVMLALAIRYLEGGIFAAHVMAAAVAYKLFFEIYRVLAVGNLYTLVSYETLSYLFLASLVASASAALNRLRARATHVGSARRAC